MGIIIVLAIVGAIVWRGTNRMAARRAILAARNPVFDHQQQVLRWISGQGPDPRAVMFCNGVPVDQNGSPELSSLSWPPPLALAPMPTPTTGTWIGTASSTATIAG